MTLAGWPARAQADKAEGEPAAQPAEASDQPDASSASGDEARQSGEEGSTAAEDTNPNDSHSDESVAEDSEQPEDAVEPAEPTDESTKASPADCIDAGGRPNDGDYLLDEETGEERKKCLDEADARPTQLGQEHPLTPEKPSNESRRKDAPTAIRWSSVGAFMGVVHRPSGSDSIRYKPGLTYGGYFRPELVKWLGVRLFYRKEFIPVDAAPGAFEQGDTPDLDFEQPKLNFTSLGLRIEPAWVIHPQFRVLGILGWSWLRFVAEMPEAPGFDIRAKRAAVEMNWQFGLGASLDIVKNWVELSVSATYNIVASQSGNAYKPVQAVYEGEIVHLGPLPRLHNATDVILQLGLIL